LWVCVRGPRSRRTLVLAECHRIDRQVITDLGRRLTYVRAAARFKKSEDDVRAPERFAAMLHARRLWAAEEGLSPDVIEHVYRHLVAHFMQEEMEQWQATS